jgi:hypothetical protein
MVDEIGPIIGDDEQDATQSFIEIIDEVLAEHPEYKPACELILRKLNARMDEEFRTMRHVAHNIANLHPGSKKKQ